MEPRSCMFGCRHPTWGGSGICRTDHLGAPMCLCDTGFASRDALGHASCVPFGVLVTGYLVLAVASLLTLVLLGRSLAEYRHISDGARRSRKTSIRLSVLLSGSFYVAGMGIVGIVLAGLGGKTSLNDAGIVQFLYLAMLPAAMFNALMIAKYWVESLPSQLMPADSFAAKVRAASEQQDIFLIMGCLNAGGIVALGVATIFIPAWPQLIADIAAVLGTIITITAILFVAVQITLCINNSSAKATPSGLLFYAIARRNLWRQAVAMSGVATVVFGAILTKRLTTPGRGTPIVFWNFQACTCHMACGLFSHFTHFEEPMAAGRRRTRSSQTLTGDLSSRRGPSLFAIGTTAAQQLFQQLHPQGWQNMARRGSDYMRRSSQGGTAVVGACVDHEEHLVETGDTCQKTRRGTVRWTTPSIAGNVSQTILGSTGTGKVLPTEGPSDDTACTEVAPS